MFVFLQEVEELEAEGRKTEQEIAALQQEKEQLEFILQAHQPMCKMEATRGAPSHTLTHLPHSVSHSTHGSHAVNAKVCFCWLLWYFVTGSFQIYLNIVRSTHL